MTANSKLGGVSRRGTVHLAGSAVACPCHVCALFHDTEEQYDLLLSFMREGYEVGDRALHIVDKDHRNERLSRLKGAGIEVEAALASGQLEIESWENAYLRGGDFNYQDMLRFVQESLVTGSQRGFARTRVWGNMEWAMAETPGCQDLAEYESRLNYVLPLYADAVVCAYDVSRFRGAVLEDIIRAHPYVLADGWLRENPYYEPPDDLLKEFETRKS